METLTVRSLGGKEARGWPTRNLEMFRPVGGRSAPGARAIVVSGSADAAVRVWDLAAGVLLRPPLKGHDGDVNALAVGELHGRTIVASGGDDRAVRLWDLASGQSLGVPLRGHRRKVRAVAVGEVHGRSIVVSGSNDNTVRVRELDSGRLLYEPFVGHHGNVTAVVVGELRGRAIAVSASEDFTLRVWDLEVGRLLGTLQGHEGFVHAVALGELGGRPVAVSGGDDKTVRVWDLDTGGGLGRPLTGHRDWVTAVAVGALGGRQVAVSGSNDQTVRVWDLAKAAPVGEPLVGHEGWVNAVALATVADRLIAVSGGDDHTVRTWDLSAGEPLGWPLRHDRGVNAVALAELQGGPPPTSGDSHRDTDAAPAGRVATDRGRDEATEPSPGTAGLSTARESVTASALTSPPGPEPVDEASRTTAGSGGPSGAAVAFSASGPSLRHHAAGGPRAGGLRRARPSGPFEPRVDESACRRGGDSRRDQQHRHPYDPPPGGAFRHRPRRGDRVHQQPRRRLRRR